MKRFLVFAGHEFYPNEGWIDFKRSFDTLEEAREFVAMKTGPAMPVFQRSDWAQVIDLETEKEAL